MASTKLTRDKIISDMEAEYQSTQDAKLKLALGKDILKLRGWDKPDEDDETAEPAFGEETLDKILGARDDDGFHQQECEGEAGAQTQANS